MRRNIGLAAAVAVIASGALATSASAHNVFVKAPDSGTIESTFIFRGTAWQANQTVRWFYDQNNNGRFDQQGRFTVGSTGNFNFRWTSNAVADIHRVCFQQYDSRRKFRRYFTACDRYETFDFVDR